ncbi:glycosyltransferase family 2 protein [Microvirga pudoricolor]|uniref:glycosyltransferase family 2 protein n=1 Tax=Microvirga pudoricolor TaxID=2778729 RepID=UPI00194E6608|nr:glycosyltransferase family 2 protein [Microvirga pudoricolor]MBM6593715.1 glycosyltransferase family 2 protein [Microvirga pudoricolor]
MSLPRRTVSVVVPVHDRIDSLRRAVQSALDQTRPPDEIVIVDDASPEPVTAEALGVDDPRIRILRLSPNRGAAGARMAGVEAARSDLVAFLDSDDIFWPGKLEAQLPLLEEAGDLVAVSCGWEARDEATGRAITRIPIPSADPVDFAGGCWFSPGCTVVIPKRAFAVCGPFDPRLRRLEDLDWFLRFALAGGALRVAPVIGCTIAIGRRAQPGPVFEAADLIEEKFSAGRDPNVTPKLLRHLRAWLDVERAVALRNGGRWFGMAAALARSLALVPRTGVQLRAWWS